MAFVTRALTAAAAFAMTGVLVVGLTYAQPGNAPAVDSPPEAKPPEPSPLLSEPATPRDTFRAILLLVDLGRFDLARAYLDNFIAGNPDDALILSLRDEFGTVAFLKLSQVVELRPLSTNLLARLARLSRGQASDPAFINGLVDRILGTDERARLVALDDLRNAGIDAVPTVVTRLDAANTPADRDRIISALVTMGAEITPAMIGSLESPSETVRGAAAQVLGWLEAIDAIPFLEIVAFSNDEADGVRLAAREALAKIQEGSRLKVDELSSETAAIDLRDRAAGLFSGRLTPVSYDDSANAVELWGWSQESGSLSRETLTLPVAARRLAARFARGALRLSPEHRPTQLLTLATLFGTAADAFPPGTPWPQGDGTVSGVAALTGLEGLSEILKICLEAGQYRAATGPLRILSDLASPAILKQPSGTKSAVVAALNSPDQRVRFLAALAIARLESPDPHPSASRVVEVLGSALTDTGMAAALVIDADVDRASQVGGFLSAMGLNPVLVRTGREGFEIAASRTGFEVVIIHANCVRWDLSQTLANFRADARTAALPIAVLGEEALRGKLARRIANSQPATFITDAPTAIDFEGQLRPWLARMDRQPLTDAERAEQKQLAAYWLARLATGPGYRAYDISPVEAEISRIAEEEPLSVNALIALAAIPSAAAQNRLVEIAARPLADVSLRLSAASLFTQHVQRFGLLADASLVRQLEDSLSKTTDPELNAAIRTALGSIGAAPGSLARQIEALGPRP